MKVPSPRWMAYMQSQMDKEEREKKRAASATSMTCSDCGGRLYKREGIHGEFLGCGNYTNCKYTQKI